MGLDNTEFQAEQSKKMFPHLRPPVTGHLPWFEPMSLSEGLFDCYSNRMPELLKRLSARLDKGDLERTHRITSDSSIACGSHNRDQVVRQEFLAFRELAQIICPGRHPNSFDKPQHLRDRTQIAGALLLMTTTFVLRCVFFIRSKVLPQSDVIAQTTN